MLARKAYLLGHGGHQTHLNKPRRVDLPSQEEEGYEGPAVRTVLRT